MPRLPTAEEWADAWVMLSLGYAGRLSIRASATERRSWDACLAEVERLRASGEQRPPELDEWVTQVALGERTRPAANRKTVRDDAVYMVAHALVAAVDGISDRAAATMAADRLKEQFPDLTAEKARNAYRAMRQSYTVG